MKKTLLFQLILVLVITVFFINQSTNTQASVFYNRVYTDVNRAFAGDVAAGRDASTVYANPAGMMLLEKPEVKGGGGFIFKDTRFNDDFTSPQGIFPNSGKVDASYDNDNFVPNLYFVYPFEHMAIGLGITTPYEIDIEYDNNWVGRFNTIKTDINSVNISPSIAFDVTNWLSFGLGVDIQYMDVELRRAKTVSDPLIQAVSGQPITIPFLIALGIEIPEFRTEFKGHDWSFGVNTGIIVKASEDLKFGLDFRSATTHSLKGNVVTTNLLTGAPDTDTATTLIAAGDTFAAVTDFKLPNILTFGGSWDVNPCWNIGAQVQWFNWGRFDEISIKTQDTGVTFDAYPEHFRDTFSVSVGTEYRPLENLAFQLGFLYDQTPTQNAFRSPVFPDGDRYWLTTGFTYEFMPGVSANLGYAHIFVRDASVNLTNNAAIIANVLGVNSVGSLNSNTGTLVQGVNNTSLSGFLDSAVDILSLSLRLEF